MWDEFIEKGIMAIGWGKVSDLKKFNTKDEMKEQLKIAYGTQSNHRNSGLALWQFCNEIQIGDKIYAKVGSSNSPVLANLTYYQAFLLLGIPEDEREKFIMEHDVKNMTTGELDRALKERKQTPLEKKQGLVTPLSNNPGEIKIEYQTVKKTDKPLAGQKLQPPKPYYKV